MSVKGWPTSQKLVKGQPVLNDYGTIQPTDAALRTGLDTVSRSAFRVNDPVVARTAGANTGNPTDGTGTVVQDNSTPARVGDYVRFEDGNAAFLELPIVEVSTNWFRLGARLDSTLEPASGESFFILRYATQRLSSDGTPIVTVSPSPIQFVRDGVDTEVEEDTDNFHNNRPLPVQTAAKKYFPCVRLDYSSTNVTTGAWVELVADVGVVGIEAITLFDGGGYAMELGVGAAASEARVLLIPPGGFNGVIPLGIVAGSRVSIRAIGAATVDAGEIDINFLR